MPNSSGAFFRASTSAAPPGTATTRVRAAKPWTGSSPRSSAPSRRLSDRRSSDRPTPISYHFPRRKQRRLIPRALESQFFSGTHAITCALFAFLRPGDEVSQIHPVHPPEDENNASISQTDYHFLISGRRGSSAESGASSWRSPELPTTRWKK